MLYIWLGVIAALILIEIFSRNFTAACFIVSAIISSILCSIFHEEYILQVCVFLVIGVLLLIFARPNVLELIKEYKKKKKKEEKKEEKKEDKKVEVKEEKKETKVTKTDNKKTPKKNTKKSTKNKAK